MYSLAASDKQGHSTLFIEFLLSALLHALREAATTDQVSDQVTDQVKTLLKCLGSKPASALECMKKLGLSHRPTFRQKHAVWRGCRAPASDGMNTVRHWVLKRQRQKSCSCCPLT